ncbi:DUF874 family protein [Helicobacter pylori]|nr:DUF874 family protein [Helicobacter pylori]
MSSCVYYTCFFCFLFFFQPKHRKRYLVRARLLGNVNKTQDNNKKIKVVANTEKKEEKAGYGYSKRV